MIQKLQGVSNETKLLIAGAISNFGTALTFLALMLLLKKNYGTETISYTFLLQNLPALFLLPRFLRWVRGHWRRSIYCWILVFMGINVATLYFNVGLWHLYFYFILAAILASLSLPIYNSLMSDWIERERIGLFQTRTHSLRLIIWSIAPPIGGYLLKRIGANPFFVIDAITFLLAAVIIFILKKPNKFASTDLPKELSHPAMPTVIYPHRMGYILTWYALGLTAFVLNGVEFAVFAFRNLSDTQVGVVLGAWGAGGFISFFGAHRIPLKSLSLEAIVVSLIGITLLFSLAPSYPVICVSMFLMGIGFTLLSGRFRHEIEFSIKDTTQSLFIWAHLQQRSTVIAVVAYGALGLILQQHFRTDFVALLLPASLSILLWFQLRAKKAEPNIIVKKEIYHVDPRDLPIEGEVSKP